MKRSRAICAAILNLLAFVLAEGSISTYFVRWWFVRERPVGSRVLMYFTVQSNLWAGIVCLAVAVWLLCSLRKERILLPRWLMLCKLIATTAVALTFLTVVVFLGPRLGYGSMYSGQNLYLHLVCPLLCILSLLLFERSKPLPFPCTLLGALPTLVYGAVYMYQVLVSHRWQDFYGFNIGGLWYVSAAVMVAVSWGLCVGLWAGSRNRKK